MPNDRVGSSEVVARQKQSIPDPIETIGQKGEKAISGDIAFLTNGQIRAAARFQPASLLGLSSRRTARFGPPEGS